MELNAIKQMERIASNRPGSISLAQGIPSVKTHERLHDAAVAAMRHGVADKYVDPQGLFSLREKISESLKRSGMHYGPEAIVVTAGAIEGLSAVLRSIISSEKSKIIVPTPVYGAYFKLIEVSRGKAVQVPLIEEEGWRLDVEAMIANMAADTAVILLCHPNNPTGTVFKRHDLERLAQEAAVRGIKIVVDEVYSNMVLSDARYYSLASSPFYRDVVIRVMSFSKDFSLTGWRIGYVHGPKDIIERVTAVHDTLVNCAPVISQYVALEALNLQNDIVSRNRLVYRKHYKIMRELLSSCPYISFVDPEAGYCLFVRIKNIEDTVEFCLRLAKHGVVAVPGSSFGQGGEGCIRLCFGRPIEDVREGTKRLINYLKETM